MKNIVTQGWGYIDWYIWDWEIQYYYTNITSSFCDSCMKYLKVKKLIYY